MWPFWAIKLMSLTTPVGQVDDAATQKPGTNTRRARAGTSASTPGGTNKKRGLL
jgi:hypothetical protein